MSFETIIELILAAVTTGAALASVYIAVQTLKQNSRNIEASTRPYIRPYLAMSNVQTLEYYLIFKNFGASSAKITKLTADIEWEHFTYEKLREPFKYIVGSELPPGHKTYTALAPIPTKKYLSDYVEDHKTPLIYSIHIEYRSESGQCYSEDTSLNMTYDFGQTHGRPHQPCQEYSLKMIANGIIDIGEKML